ncbi:MAG: adenylate/guanylate cyclase domain-containing protein [Anaerolineales bacterium]
MAKSHGKHASKAQYEENWYWYLTGENRDGFTSEYENSVKVIRRVAGLLPGDPRCFECNLPLAGMGTWVLKTRPSSFSPRLCNLCEEQIKTEEAGAEVELTMLFADMRGSTTLAQTLAPTEFKELIQRFYQAAGEALVRQNAMVNRLIGDQVIGLFVPRFAGARHAQAALETAQDLLRATGHADPAGPWAPVGIGLHTGLAWVGAVGTKAGVNEIAVLGSGPNLAARLSSQAGAGEILLSEAAAASAGLAGERLERRELTLKGIEGAVGVRVVRVREAS